MLETSDERDREARGRLTRFGRALLNKIIFDGYKDGRTPDGREWVDIARWFVAQGVDINSSDIYLPLLSAACSYSYLSNMPEQAALEMVKMLLAAGADVNPRGWVFERSPLFYAAGCEPYSPAGTFPTRRVHEDIVCELLRAGAAVPHHVQPPVREWLEMTEWRMENRRGVDADALAAIKRHILGVLEAGSWRDYIMRPRLEILTLRGLVNRAKLRRAATKLRRSPRRSRNISSSDPAPNNLVALPNELLCKVLAYWRA